MAEAAAIQLMRVGVAYGEAFAVRGVDLVIEPGGSVGVVGPNGAGKSTIMNCIAGLVPPREGTIFLGGSDVTGRPAWARARAGLSLVPDGGAVFGDLTVENNLQVACRGSRARRRELLADVYEAFPRLGERRSVDGGSLSGGEQRMLALARALMTQPRIMILDESTVGLSWAMVDRLSQLLEAERRERGLTLLVAGEDLTFIRQVCQHVHFLDHGRLTPAHTMDELADPDVVRKMYFGSFAGTGA